MAQTFTIQVNSTKAFQLLKDLEALELIKILPDPLNLIKRPADLLKGSVTSQQADAWRQELTKMRDEWVRDF